MDIVSTKWGPHTIASWIAVPTAMVSECLWYWKLVGGLVAMFYFPRNIGNFKSSQLTNSYFSEGWPNHQPVLVWALEFCATHTWHLPGIDQASDPTGDAAAANEPLVDSLLVLESLSCAWVGFVGCGQSTTYILTMLPYSLLKHHLSWLNYDLCRQVVVLMAQFPSSPNFINDVHSTALNQEGFENQRCQWMRSDCLSDFANLWGTAWSWN